MDTHCNRVLLSKLHRKKRHLLHTQSAVTETSRSGSAIMPETMAVVGAVRTPEGQGQSSFCDCEQLWSEAVLQKRREYRVLRDWVSLRLCQPNSHKISRNLVDYTNFILAEQSQNISCDATAERALRFIGETARNSKIAISARILRGLLDSPNELRFGRVPCIVSLEEGNHLWAVHPSIRLTPVIAYYVSHVGPCRRISFSSTSGTMPTIGGMLNPYRR
ncbi:hypothetical protein JB92DRAFT_153954 [Gautieria morchelliformis]|nr:hypothetical protein JB92DRAFT_153954 [Gautieria morchelliformis]